MSTRSDQPFGASHSQSRPGKRGFPDSISARIQPTDQTSMALVYSLKLKSGPEGGGISIMQNSHRLTLSAPHSRQHNFGCSIPSRGHILRHETGALCLWLVSAPSQAEITYFQVAIGIEEQIARFEVSMQDLSRVQRLESSKRLIDKVLAVIV